MQKGQLQILLLIGILMIAAGIGVYFLRSNYSNNRYKTNSQNPVVTPQTPQPTPTFSEVDETANWRLFNNSTISFKYPNDWSIEDEANVVTIFGPNQRMFPDPNDTTYKYFPFYVKIVRHANTQYLEEKDWAKKNILTYCSGEVTKSPLSFDNSKIGEVSGIKVTAVDTPPTLISKRGDQIWTFSINIGYCDGGSPVDENETKTKFHINIFNKILSTFKFL